MPAPAWGQHLGEPADPRPDPSKFARGFYAQAEAGVVSFLGEAAEPLGTGPAFGTRVGYEIFRFLALQVHGGGSTHSIRLDDRPQDGQLLQILRGAAELKLTVPLSRWSLFAHGGGGLARLSSNLLGTAGLTELGVRLSPIYGGGAGVDYHTASRHFSFGLAVDFQKLPRLNTVGALASSAYIRYTF